MKVLISNDDGYLSQGLQSLYKVLSEQVDVTVVAPDKDRSGASNSLTIDNPLRVKERGDRVFSVDGTPTDCVHLAVTGLFDELPDIVISGINHGCNMGDDILYSGTVAAATEGRFLGLPAIAISLDTEHKPFYFETAAHVACELLQRLLSDPLPVNTILNVNVPNVPLQQLKGYRITRLGTRHKSEAMTKQIDPRGREIYWVGRAGAVQDAGVGTDFHAVAEGYVSVTPLKIDLTYYEAMDQLSTWTQQWGLSCSESL